MTAVVEANGRVTDEAASRRHYVHPVTLELLTSVTTINGATLGKDYLQDWAAKIAAQYAIAHLDELARVKAGESPEAAVDIAKTEARRLRKLKADAGSYVHAAVEQLIIWSASPLGSAVVFPDLPDHLAGQDYDDDPIEQVTGEMIAGFTNFVEDFGPEFLAAEMPVYNRDLGYAGTLDMILGLTGYGLAAGGERFTAEPGRYLKLCVDVKTGRYYEVTWPEQIAPYRRARECQPSPGLVGAMPETDAGAILHLRPEFPRGYRLMLIAQAKDAAGWNRFRRSIELFNGREAERDKPGAVVYALRPDGTMPAPRLRDLDGEGYDRAPGALAKAGVTDLEQLAAMSKGDCLKCKGVGPKTIPHIRRMLADHGLSLRGEENLALIPAAADPAAQKVA
jgi:hypothetical protein